MNNIISTICRHEGINKKMLLGRCKERELVRIRQAIIYSLFLTDKYTLKEIGAAMNRHHSTIIYACNEARKLMKKNPDFVELFNRIENVGTAKV